MFNVKDIKIRCMGLLCNFYLPFFLILKAKEMLAACRKKKKMEKRFLAYHLLT